MKVPAVNSSLERSIEKTSLLFLVNVWGGMSFYTVTIKNGSNTKTVALFSSQRTMTTVSIWIIIEPFDVYKKKRLRILELPCIASANRIA